MASLLERERELAALAAAVTGVADGSGDFVVIEGPAGIGKTTLMAEARALAADAGLDVLRARGSEVQRDYAFGVVRQLFEAGLELGDREALLHGATARTAALLGLLEDTEEGGATSFTAVQGLYWLCQGLAAQCGPLLLAIDDLHACDGASLRCLTFLAERIDELPVLVVAAARPEDIAGDLFGLRALIGRATVLNPEPLSGAGVAALLDAELGTAPPEVAGAAFTATGGTPFLVRSLCDGIRSEQLTPDSTELVEAIGARNASRWITLRLRGLRPDAVTLARALAILETAPVADAAALAGLTEGEAREAADALVAGRIFAPGEPLRFAHAMLRDAVYEEMSDAERAEGHARAAELLDDEQAVPHLSQAEPAGDPAVVERLLSAARAADRRGAPESAAAHLRRALAEPPAPEQRADVLLGLGTSAAAVGDPEAFAVLEEAVDAAETPEARVRAALVLMHALTRAGRFAEVEGVSERVAAGLDDVQALALEAALIIPTALSRHTAPALAPRALALRERADQLPEPPRPVLAFAALLAAWGESASVAAELARRTFAAPDLPEPAELPWLPLAAGALIWAEAYDEVEPRLDEALEQARATSDTVLLPEAITFRALLNLRRGELSAAVADAVTALHGPWPLPPLYHDMSVAFLAEALAAQGRLEDAEAELDTYLAAADPSPLVRYGRAQLRLAQGRHEEALADLRAVGATAAATRVTNPAALAWRSGAALALRGLGERDEATALAEEELALARSFGAPRALARALRVAEQLEEAEALARSVHAPLELARILHLRGDGAALEEALDLARRAGADGLAADIEADLRATGAEPPPAPAPGLTAAERRVADLARQGLTDPQIAQTLFVTPPLVQRWLADALGKLGIARDELR